MTTKTDRPHNVHRSDVDRSGNGQGQSDPPTRANADLADTPTASPDTETRTIPLRDRSGNRVYRELTRVEWALLHERHLVTLQWTSRKRNRIAEVRLAAGVSVAECNAVLRMGMRDRLPMPPPTVIQIRHVGMRYEHNAKVCRTYGPPCPNCGGYHDGACES